MRKFLLLTLILLSFPAFADGPDRMNPVNTEALRHSPIVIMASLKTLAKEGYPKAQSMLAKMYFTGNKNFDVPQDYTQALFWSKKAAEQGDVIGQEMLGFLYYQGYGVPQDYKQAFSWLKKAADQGEKQAEAHLGAMYYDGQGALQDYTQALVWFKKAAEQGEPYSQFNLCKMYYFGEVIPQDYAQAFYWGKKAAEQGMPKAQGLLGGMYYFGQGVPQDYLQAYKWLNLASAAGDKSAPEFRDSIAQEMTPEQIAEAQRQASDWYATHSGRSSFDDQSADPNR